MDHRLDLSLTRRSLRAAAADLIVALGARMRIGTGSALLLGIFAFGSTQATACDWGCGWCRGYGYGYYAAPAPVYYAPPAYTSYAPAPAYYAPPAYSYWTNRSAVVPLARSIPQ